MQSLEARYTVDISKPIRPTLLNMILVKGDANANKITVDVVDNGQPVILAGQCKGTAKRSDGNTVPIDGTIAGSSLSIVLPAAAYAVKGAITIVIYCFVEDVNKVSVFVGMGEVTETDSGIYIDPGTVLDDIDDLEDAIADAVASIPSDYSDLLSTIAPIFDNTANYGAGELVWYSGTLYKFIVPHPAGNWIGTDAKITTVAAELQSGGNASIDDTAGAGDTDKVWSADKTFSEFDQVKNALNYQPMAIAAFTASPATAELGDTPKAVTLACEFNKTPASVSLDGAEKAASYTGETVSAEDGGTHSKSWTLSATDAGSWADDPHTAQATAQIKWLPKVYYGTAAIPEEINSAFLLGLSNGVLATSRTRTFTITAGSGQYIWYASPANYGACAFSVGGFDGGFEAAQIVSVVNASGYTQNYYVYRSSNANLGSTTVVVK